MQASCPEHPRSGQDYQKLYDDELRNYIHTYSDTHPGQRIHLNGSYCRSIRIWDSSADDYLEISIRVSRVRICGTNVSWVFQSTLLSPRRHYLRSFMVESIRAVLCETNPLSILRYTIEKFINPSVWWRWYTAFCESLSFLIDFPNPKRENCTRWLEANRTFHMNYPAVKRGLLWDGAP